MLEVVIGWAIAQAIISFVIILFSLLNAAIEDWKIGDGARYVLRGALIGLVSSPFGIVVLPLSLVVGVLSALFFGTKAVIRLAFPRS